MSAGHVEKILPGFESVEADVAAALKSDGYDLIRSDAQGWAALYSLTRSNLDGAVSLFFGPIYEHPDGRRVLPFQIGRSELWRDSIDLPRDADTGRAAKILIDRITGILTETLQSPHESNPNVGAGLLPVSAERAQRDIGRQDAPRPDSAR